MISEVEYDENQKRLQEYNINITNFNDIKKGIVGMEFVMKRNSMSFIMKYFLPCFWLVSLTMVSFFIPPNVVPGRGGMLVTLFLVLNNISGNAKV